jgi:heavy-metal resistance protein
MSPFLSGALGALALVVTLGALRRVLWFRRLRRWRAGGPLPLRRLFARLGTRPEQEAVLSAEAEVLWRELGALREDGRAARQELAELFSHEALDAAEVSAALDRRLEHLQALRTEVAAGLARVHATLDAGQRARLVALVRHGPGGHRRHAHGRC